MYPQSLFETSDLEYTCASKRSLFEKQEAGYFVCMKWDGSISDVSSQQVRVQVFRLEIP